jgi:hypothetical protein
MTYGLSAQADAQLMELPDNISAHAYGLAEVMLLEPDVTRWEA